MPTTRARAAADRARVNQHQELMPPVPPDPVSADDLAALFGRLEDAERGLDAVRLALWPGWWSVDMTGVGERAEARAARRAWAIGKEGAAEHVVLVYDLDTAERLGLAPPPA